MSHLCAGRGRAYPAGSTAPATPGRAEASADVWQSRPHTPGHNPAFENRSWQLYLLILSTLYPDEYSIFICRRLLSWLSKLFREMVRVMLIVPNSRNVTVRRSVASFPSALTVMVSDFPRFRTSSEPGVMFRTACISGENIILQRPRTPRTIPPLVGAQGIRLVVPFRPRPNARRPFRRSCRCDHRGPHRRTRHIQHSNNPRHLPHLWHCANCTAGTAAACPPRRRG